jgi:signal transduction histidine kinase
LTGNPDFTGTDAVIDREGRLVSASPRFLEAQLAAGGRIGGEVAVPQLASLARMVRSLQANVSRPVVIAHGDEDVTLMAEGRLQDGLVAVSAPQWSSSSPSSGLLSSHEQPASHFAELESDGSWTSDARLVLLEMSPAFLRFAGGELAGRKLHQLFQLNEDEKGNFPLLDALLDLSPFYGQEAELRDGSGTRALLHGMPKIGPGGRIAGFSGGIRLLDRRAATRIRPRMATDFPAEMPFAERLDAALRKPLARIIEQADQIGGQSDGPIRLDYRTYANDISSAGRHLLRLADDIADLQAVEQPGFVIAPEDIDLADLARRASTLMSVRATDKGVRISSPAVDERLPSAGDFGRVLQILVNLISNAVRYTPDNGMVWVRTELEGDIAAVIVADQGKGIVHEAQARIFEKFHRVDPTEPGGSGLGLYISRKLARAMGGDITVDSAPRCRAGADGRSSGSGPRSFPSTARSSRRCGQREEHGEHGGREAHRLQRDARIEVDVRVELLLDEVLVVQRDRSSSIATRAAGRP